MYKQAMPPSYVSYPVAGSLLGAFATLANADNAKKDKMDLLRLVLRNGVLGGAAGGGAYLTGLGGSMAYDSLYNTKLKGDPSASILVKASFHKRAEETPASTAMEPIPLGLTSGSIIALLHYLTAEEKNPYKSIGLGGLAGMGVGIGKHTFDTTINKKANASGLAYQFNYYQKTGSVKLAEGKATDSVDNTSTDKKKDDTGADSLSVKMNNPLIWGALGAATAGGLSYLTRDKSQFDKERLLKHIIIGGALGAGANIGYNLINTPKEPEPDHPDERATAAILKLPPDVQKTVLESDGTNSSDLLADVLVGVRDQNSKEQIAAENALNSQFANTVSAITTPVRVAREALYNAYRKQGLDPEKIRDYTGANEAILSMLRQNTDLQSYNGNDPEILAAQKAYSDALDLSMEQSQTVRNKLKLDNATSKEYENAGSWLSRLLFPVRRPVRGNAAPSLTGWLFNGSAAYVDPVKENMKQQGKDRYERDISLEKRKQHITPYHYTPPEFYY